MPRLLLIGIVLCLQIKIEIFISGYHSALFMLVKLFVWMALIQPDEYSVTL